MRFSFHHCMCPIDQYVPLAIAAEELGYHGISIPDSICYPEQSDSYYPYNTDGSRDFLENVPFIEPFILAAHMAAVTRNIQFTTSVMKLAIRQPVIVAKQLSSLALISGNRFHFGVGISPWQEDFEVSQVSWQQRGKRMDEMIEIIRNLMKKGYSDYQGDIFSLPSIKLNPVPETRIPILVGGHSHAALDRAARLGDGWISAGASFDEIRNMINQISELRSEYQREHTPFTFSVTAGESLSVDAIQRLNDIGVNEVTVGFRDVYAKEMDVRTVDEKIKMMRWFADEVVSNFPELDVS